MRYAHFSKKLKELRLTQDLSFEQLGALTGLTGPVIEALEHGKLHPSRDSVLLLAKTLGANEAEFLIEAGFIAPGNYPCFYTSVLVCGGVVQCLGYFENLRDAVVGLRERVENLSPCESYDARIFDNEAKEVYVRHASSSVPYEMEYYCDHCDCVFREEPASDACVCPQCQQKDALAAI